MKKMNWRIALPVAVALAVSGCASDDEDEVVIAPLPVFEAKFSPKLEWETQIDTSIGEDITDVLAGTWYGLWPWAGVRSQADRAAEYDVRTQLIPLWYNETYYVVNREGLLTAFDASGKEKFRRWLSTPISAGVSASAGYLFVATPEGEVIALNADNGDEKWRNVVSSEIISTPSVADGFVVVRCVDGKLFALDIETGERKWFVDRNVPALTQRGTSTPAVVGGLVLAGFDNGKVSAFRLQDGKDLWEKRVGQPTGRSEIERIADVDADPLVFGSTMYAASFNGSVIAVDLRNGETLWQRDMSTYRNMGIDAQMLFVSTAQGHISAIDRRNGFVVWTQKALENRFLTAPVMWNDYVVIGDSEGYIHFLDRNDGHFVSGGRFDADGYQAPPQVFNDKLVLYGNSGKLSVYAGVGEFEGQSRLKCRLLNARVYGCFGGTSATDSPYQ